MTYPYWGNGSKLFCLREQAIGGDTSVVNITTITLPTLMTDLKQSLC